VTYVELTDHEGMIVTKKISDEGETINVVSTDYVDDVAININSATVLPDRSELLRGEKRELREHVANLLYTFLSIVSERKKIMNVSYEDIMDRNFKLKEKEKNIMTDRLKEMSNEKRAVDNVMKIHKLGLWSKGIAKGLTTYVKDAFDEEYGFRGEMEKLDLELMGEESVFRNEMQNTLDIGPTEQEELLDVEQIEENAANEEIEKEAYDMSHYTPDYYDGNYEGEEEEHFEEYD
jgi:hypothetical protein